MVSEQRAVAYVGDAHASRRAVREREAHLCILKRALLNLTESVCVHVMETYRSLDQLVLRHRAARVMFNKSVATATLKDKSCPSEAQRRFAGGIYYVTRMHASGCAAV